MRSISPVVFALACAAGAAPAWAQDTAPPPPITVSGTVTAISDYRFRGVSQSDKEFAVQGGFTVTHESGFYVGTWGSNLAGWGQFGGANHEVDVIGGFKKAFGPTTVDVGLTWYMYPGGATKTDFAEPYIRVSGTRGPVTLTAAIAYAPKQEALGRWYLNGASAAAGVYDRPGAKKDNLYLAGDGVLAVPDTKLSLRAHIGYSEGNRGLGPNGTSVAPTGKYWDWNLGADYALFKGLSVGVSYVDTDISGKEQLYLQPSFSKGQDGAGSIADAAFLFQVTAAF